MQLHTKQSGFTLVEIAIVLVIVGLLIGGVLQGQEMIGNARFKRVQSDIAGIAAAMFAYQDRYRALPGDDARATDRFEDFTDVKANGNGDGIVGGNWDDKSNWTAGSDGETRKFFAHLIAAGLLSGNSGSGDKDKVSIPTHPYGGNIGIQNSAFGIPGLSLILGGISGDIAERLDNNGDDGSAKSGRIRAIEGGSVPITAPGDDYDATKSYSVAFRL